MSSFTAAISCATLLFSMAHAAFAHAKPHQAESVKFAGIALEQARSLVLAKTEIVRRSGGVGCDFVEVKVPYKGRHFSAVLGFRGELENSPLVEMSVMITAAEYRALIVWFERTIGAAKTKTGLYGTWATRREGIKLSMRSTGEGTLNFNSLALKCDLGDFHGEAGMD